MFYLLFVSVHFLLEKPIFLIDLTLQVVYTDVKILILHKKSLIKWLNYLLMQEIKVLVDDVFIGVVCFEATFALILLLLYYIISLIR